VVAALEEALVAAAWRGAERERGERISWGSFDLGFHPVFFFWMFIYHRPTSLCNCHTRCGVALWTIGPSCTRPQLSVSQTGRQEVRNRITRSNGRSEKWEENFTVRMDPTDQQHAAVADGLGSRVG
jgi:hypothetical protein